MDEPRRIISFTKPKAFLDLGNCTYYYNYDIVDTEAVSIETTEENEAVETMKPAYSFVQVLIYGKHDYKECVKAVIRQYLTLDEEFDLINSYNSAVINNITTGKDITDYQLYLQLLTTIKTLVKKDFNED